MILTMKKNSLLLLLLVFCSVHSFAGISLRENTTYTLYTSPKAPKVLNYAANELELYLKKTVGVVCKYETTSLCSDYQLILAESAPVSSVQIAQKAGEDGYVIKVDNHSLSITGGNARGALYGVYAFLEKYLKCRWYASDAFLIPFSGTTKLKNVEEAYTPPIKWREVLYYDLCDPYLAGVFKLNGNANKKKEVSPNRFVAAGGSNAGWGYWCESFYRLVPPSLYALHPEYFPEIKGKRVPPIEKRGGTQLCLTNPDVLKLSIDQLKKDIAEPITGLPIWADTVAYYWSVSQMDGNGFCTCSKCKALDDYDGSHSGSILNYVNKVAENFPEKKIATLAYIYSRKAPIHTKPLSNVAIQLCAIETARDAINEPIRTSQLHTLFRDDIKAWGKICNDIIIWDYEIQFQNLVSPFPNFDVMQDNIKFYVDNHSTGIFCQGNREKGGEFAKLRAYLLSKLLWNPNCDIEKVKDDFLTNYYGSASNCIKQYIATMEDGLKKSKLRLSMDGEPEEHRKGYLSDSYINKYVKLFDSAEQSVKDDSVLLARVKEARMPLMYVQLRFKMGSKEERKQILDELIHLAEINNIWMFSEVDWRKDQSGNREMFRKKIEADL